MSLWRGQRRRVKALADAQAEPLRAYLTPSWPSRKTPVEELRLLAVDLETTGLEPAQHQILSVGFVPIDGTTIVLREAGEMLVRPEGAVGDSATIHGLTDDVVGAGGTLQDALDVLLRHLVGRILVAHHAVIETGFLSAACERVYGQPLPVYSIDTMRMQERVVSRGFPADTEDGSLRLWAARERYGLPLYAAHTALTDALACAELFVAQVAELGAKRTVLLKDLL